MKLNAKAKLPVLLTAILLWCASAWLLTLDYYHQRADALIQQETLLTQERAQDLADSIQRNLNYLNGIPKQLSHLIRVNKAVTRFGMHAIPSSLSPEARRKRLLADPALNDLSQYLAVSQTSLNVDMIFVVNAAGISIADSLWNKPGTSTGTSYSDRAWFQMNQAGQDGMQYAVGRTTHVPGLYFSSPVLINGKFMGAVVAKIDVPNLSFLIKQIDSYVVDKNGVVILAHDKSEEMLALAGAPINKMSTAEKENVYRRSVFSELPIVPWGNTDFPTLLRIGGKDVPVLLATKELPAYGLTVYVECELNMLESLKKNQIWFGLLLALFGSVLIMAIAGVSAYVRSIKRTKDAIRTSEQRLSFALEGSGDGVWEWNLQTGELILSDTGLAMLGFAGDEAGKDMRIWSARIHPEDTARWRDDTLAYFKGSRPNFSSEYRMRCKDGSWKWILTRGMAVSRSADGRVLQMFGTQSDISGRKKNEQREASRNRVLQMLTENAPLPDVLDTICRDVEMMNPAMMCSILLVDDAGKHLGSGAAPSLPEFYNQAIDGISIGMGVGSCGTAAFTGQRVIVEDIETHPYWAPYLELTHRAGLGSCWSQPIFSSQGKVLGTFGVYHRHAKQPTPADIRLIEEVSVLAALAIEKREAESRLKLAASVFTHAREGVFITDTDGIIIDANDTFTAITGYKREEALGKNPRMLKSGRQSPEFYASMWRILNETGNWTGEIWNQSKNGKIYAAMQTISAVRDANGKTQNYVALFSDITPMKEHQQQLEHIAHYDALTSLPNRVLLADRLKQAMSSGQRRGQMLAVIYLDLDGFKAVNDRYGHDTGDELLIAVSKRMKAALRDGDTLSRIGGDEFVAVLVDLEQPQDCEPILVRLLQAAADPVLVAEVVMQVSASIGVTLYPQDGADADQLIRHADQAMYAAKQAGKNRYHLFDVRQDAAVQIQRESLAHIRLALERREFVLHYQPKVNMKSGEVIGTEALIRWQHPERGLLAPAAFLPIIENHPISVDLGNWVINAALAQLHSWHAAGLDIPVSVNVGALQLQQDDFTTRLAEQLAMYPDIPPHCLELEILETSALEDLAHISEIMHDCRAIGVSFALDDFGTGYSSLTYLKHLPAELIKIDRSFVCDMLTDANDLAIVQGVIGLAKAFHREVIAEGVETDAHGSLLLSMGCELAQGYGIARPMPAAELADWVAKRPAASCFTGEHI